MTVKRRNLSKLLAAIFTAITLVAAVGCTPSETIMQIIYDQDPQNEVDVTQTLLVNDPNAEKASDTLPKLVSDETNANAQNTKAELPRYGGDTSEVLVAKPVEGPTEEEGDVESSQAGDDSDSATANAPGKGSDSEKSPEGESGVQGEDDGEDDPGADFEPDDGRGDDAGDDGENPDFQGDDDTPTGKGKNAKNEVKVYKDYGEFPEIPEDIHRVTAVGQAAVIVSMLGGTADATPLLGADENLLDDEQAQRVLAGKGLASVAKVWKNDGTAEGDLLDVQDVIDLDPELCFVTEGEDTLTKEQEDALLEANIIVYVLPNMTSPSKIVYAVQLVGEILAEGGNAQAGELAGKYSEFHNNLVTTIASNNNGVTGGFDYDTGRDVATGASPLYSLYISDWDYDARYDDPVGYIETPEGVAVTDVGYETHPVSYYMSVGGVSNTAALSTFRVLSGYSAPVWQFSLSQAPCTWSDWTRINREKVSYELKGNGFSYALLWANEGQGYGLGTPEFPGVIVATQQMKTSMQAEALRSRGIYYPYPATSSSRGGIITATMVGFDNGLNLVASCIGTTGGGLASALNNGSGQVGSYDIHVNPHGLFSSWTDGSVESVLECAWVYKTFRDENYDLDTVVRGFYHDFYGFDLADDLETVLAGKAS